MIVWMGLPDGREVPVTLALLIYVAWLEIKRALYMLLIVSHDLIHLLGGPR